MNKFRWIIFGIICVLVLGGLVVLANRDKKDVSNVNANSILTGQNGSIGDHVYGNKNAKVIVFEYGDFQCPGCGGAYPKLTTIKETYKAQIAFVFRNFPLTSIHPNALAAASAAEAAGLQGKFWEMHNQLYENQNSWSSASTSSRNDIFEQYARTIGLDIPTYRKDITSKAVADKIALDRAIGSKINVDSTPTLFIGNEKVSAAIIQNVVNDNGNELTKAIDNKLKMANVALPASN